MTHNSLILRLIKLFYRAILTPFLSTCFGDLRHLRQEPPCELWWVVERTESTTFALARHTRMGIILCSAPKQYFLIRGETIVR